MIFVTRDECDKLSKIIQTRVVDPPSVEVSRYGMQKERLSRTNSNIVSPPEARWPVDHLTELPETILYSSPRLSPISPRKWLLHSQDLHSTAVMEAKKWLEEKKSSPNSKSDLNSSPCTDVPQYVSTALFILVNLLHLFILKCLCDIFIVLSCLYFGLIFFLIVYDMLFSICLFLFWVHLA